MLWVEERANKALENMRGGIMDGDISVRRGADWRSHMQSCASGGSRILAKDMPR